MTIDPDDFLTAARQVYNGDSVDDDETNARVTLGRAYYSAYLSVRRAVRTASGRQGVRLEHQELADALDSPSEPQHVQDIGARLNGLRSNRNRADYDLDDTITRMEAGLAVHDAESVVNSASQNAADILRAVHRNYSP